MTLREALHDALRLLTTRPTKRLYIPSLMITVPLYPTDGKDAQQIVDASNSAVWMEWPNFPVIADHRSQRFSRLPNAKPCITMAYIREKGKPEQAFICLQKYLAVIKDGTLVSERDGSDVRLHGCKLLMYTCSGREVGGCCEVWVTEWDNAQ